MSSENVTPEPQPEPTPSALPPETAPEAAPPPPPRFEAQPYAPDGTSPPLGLALTLGGGLAAAVIVGFVASFIGQWFYLVLLFPAVIGGALGVVGMVFIKVGKLRNPLLAGIAAGLSGVMAMGTKHYVDYQRFIDNVQQKLPLERGELEKLISFPKYIDLMATEGVTISRAAHNDKGMNLGYVGSYIYWLVEMAIVAGIAWILMRIAAAEPFCVGCNSWKDERRVAEMKVPTEDMAVRAVQDGDVVKLLQCAGPIQADGLVIKAAVCPNCGGEGEVDIILDRLTKNAKGEWSATTLTRMTYPGEVLGFLPGGTGQ